MTAPKFKVGDRVVKFKSSPGADIKAGTYSVVMKDPTGTDLLGVAINHSDYVDGFCTTSWECWELADVYDSPLFRELK